MGNQFRDGNEEFILPDKSMIKVDPIEKNKKLDIKSDAFKDIHHVRHVYNELCREYNLRIATKYSHLTKAKAQFPPYWDDNANAPQELPLYQHNVSSGRYGHSITQLSLTYNSFFPTQSYNKNLIDIKIIPDDKLLKDEDTPDKLDDYSRLIRQAFDNLVKQSSWARREHLKLVSNILNYGYGLYYFEDGKDYKYKSLDVRKVKFPSGTTTVVDDWEYLYIEHEVSFYELVKKYETPTKGWQKKGLEGVLNVLISKAITTSGVEFGGGANGVNKVDLVDMVREGLKLPQVTKVCPAKIPVATCFWKDKDGKISLRMFASMHNTSAHEYFLYEKEAAFEKFSDAFSLFPGDETEDEIRMCRGWGEKIHPLCHAYDRGFCKFLDHIDHVSTLFMTMDPNDIHKKIVHYGSLNIGKFDNVQMVSQGGGLKAVLESLLFLDSKIDQITFTRGLNNVELHGEGRGAELAGQLLTMEMRVHKHLMSRFIDRYTDHYKTVMSKVLNLALKSKSSSMNNEVKTKFYTYLKDKDVPERIFQMDDTSALNNDLPSNWLLTAQKPDNSGVAGALPHTLQLLAPYMSSFPEAGFRYLLSRIVADAFNDEDMVEKILPGAEIAKASAEVDAITAEMQIAILTGSRSAFDNELEIPSDTSVEATDASKFITFPASKEQDQFIFLTLLLNKVDDAVDRFNRREFGRPTLHIWLFNLVSTAQNHVQILRQDQIRGKRPEAAELFSRFGQAFNLLRQVESQANAEKAKKLDALGQKIAEQDQADPRRMEATAKLETARAKQSEVQLNFSVKQIETQLAVAKNRRDEEAHLVDQQVKLASLRNPAIDVTPSSTS